VKTKAASPKVEPKKASPKAQPKAWLAEQLVRDFGDLPRL